MLSVTTQEGRLLARCGRRLLGTVQCLGPGQHLAVRARDKAEMCCTSVGRGFSFIADGLPVASLLGVALDAAGLEVVLRCPACGEVSCVSTETREPLFTRCLHCRKELLLC